MYWTAWLSRPAWCVDPQLTATAAGAALSAGRGIGLLSEADTKAFVRYDLTVDPRVSADEADERLTTWKGRVYG